MNPETLTHVKHDDDDDDDDEEEEEEEDEEGDEQKVFNWFDTYIEWSIHIPNELIGFENSRHELCSIICHIINSYELVEM